MSITINDNLKLNAGKPLDAKYLNGTVPYTSILEVNTLVPIAERSIGLTVNINNNDYWYANGVTDPDLVLKSYGGSPDFCSITLHTDIQIGADVNFTKTNYGSEVDNIDTNIAITRGNSQSIFNQAFELGYVLGAPTGTLWNWSTWGTLEDVKTRTYVNFVDALLNNVGINVVGAELVMWDTINDKYYKVLFNQWTQGGLGGGFSYTRNLITVVCDGSIHFPDGSTLTTANISVTPTNGLSIITGTSVGLGGQLIQPTVIDASLGNTFSLVDGVGTMIRTRDANANFILNAIYGLPTFTASNLIFAFTSDGGTSFTNSTIVYNFGGANSFNGTVDTFSFGDYHVFTNVFQSYNFGRNNNVTNGSNIHLLGDFNTLSSCYGVNVFGNNNTISSQNNKFYIGNYNKNLVVDNNGYVGIGTDSPAQILTVDAGSQSSRYIYMKSIGVDCGVIIDSGEYPAFVMRSSGLTSFAMQGVGQNLMIFRPTNSIEWRASNTNTSMFGCVNMDIAVNSYSYYRHKVAFDSTGSIVPFATVHIKGEDATSSNYALKVDNSASSSLLQVVNNGSFQVGRAYNSGYNNTNFIDFISPSAFSTQQRFSIGFDSKIYANIDPLNTISGGAMHVGSGGTYQYYTNANFGRVEVNNFDTTKSLGWIYDNPSGTDYLLSIIKTDSSGRIVTIDQVSGNFGIGTGAVKPTSKLQVVGLPTYVDNASAILGGLTTGAMYIRTGHGLDIVI